MTKSRNDQKQKRLEVEMTKSRSDQKQKRPKQKRPRAVKRVVNPKPFKRQTYLQSFTHSLENCQVPAPMEDWDDIFGSIDHYKQAQKAISLEMGLTLLANLLTHLFMTLPLFVLAKNIHERHETLEKSIGALPEEKEAYTFCLIMALFAVLLLIFGTILQFHCYELYNKTFHPFIDLTKEARAGNINFFIKFLFYHCSHPFFSKNKCKFKKQ